MEEQAQMNVYPEYLLVSSRRYRLEVAPAPRPLYFVPHDVMRFDYDDPLREHSLGWKYNPARTGKVRHSASIASQPEVYRVSPWQGFRFNEAWKQLLVDINPDLLPEKALTLLGAGLAFCNGEYGRFDGPRVMGGWTVTGEERDGKLWVDTLKVNDPIWSAEAVLADPTKWGWCVSVRPDGQIGLWHRLGKDGQMHPCRMLIVSSVPVWVPLDEVLPVGEVKPPQWMG